VAKRNNVDKRQLLKYQQTAEKIAIEAGQILLKYRGKARVLRSKRDFGDIVTEADEASEKHIIISLKKAFPTHSFLSEESGQTKQDSEYRWVIDPLDGTKEFAKGIPLFAVIIALEYKEELILGIAYHPVFGDLYSAAMQQGCKLNGRNILASSNSTLEESIVYVHASLNVPWKKLDQIAKRTYRLNLGYMEQFYCPWIALGAYDAYWYASGYAGWWDMAPLIILVQEAGGRVTTSKGNKVTEENFKSEGILATNGKIHDQLLALIQKGT